MEGHVLAGKYEITRLLGRGGMGAVYEARNHLGKRMAVKLLLDPSLSKDDQLVQRFFREAKASAAIESDHIVEVYDTGVDAQSGFPFIVMEMLKGEDLEHTLRRVGALDLVAATRVVSQAAHGLASAHAAGIVHRDIKPANVFMTMRGHGELVVKILDFGIAKQTVEQLQNASSGLTRTGSMLGTPLYMSPEQARGLRTVDARSDVWSLGVCLYEALSGRTPWGNVETLGDLILAICTQDAARLEDYAPWVPRELCAVVHRALARDPSARTPSARALVDDLARFTGDAITLTPDLLVPVAPEQRVPAVAPRLARGTLSGTSSMTASQVSSGRVLTRTDERTLGAVEKKSRVVMFVGIGATIVALATCGGVASWYASHRASAGVEGPSVGEDPRAPDPVVEPPLVPSNVAPAPSACVSPPPMPAISASASSSPSTGKTIKPLGIGGKIPAASSVTTSSSTTGATKLKAAGESCTVDAECASTTCLAGRCSRKITGTIDP